MSVSWRLVAYTADYQHRFTAQLDGDPGLPEGPLNAEQALALLGGYRPGQGEQLHYRLVASRVPVA